MRAAHVFAWFSAWGLIAVIEFRPAVSLSKAGIDLDLLISLLDLESLAPFAILLAVAPLVWRSESLLHWPGSTLLNHCGNMLRNVLSELAECRCGSSARAAVFAAVVFGVSLSANAWLASRIGDLPPAFHDEYSYLFQARTFAAGRLWFPSHEAPELFDQMHVLNEGKFASRYFPGTGLWMAPWVVLGHPYWGHWFAGALASALVFFTVRELAGDVAGLIAGLLTAVSPAIVLFSNLLLSHQPTLVGLGFFFVGYLRMLRLHSPFWAGIAGVGLAFAMICRPMTAAAIGLPFGLYFVWVSFRRRSPESEDNASRPSHSPASTLTPPPLLPLWIAMSLPLAATTCAWCFYNRAITDDPLVTPYALYTQIYTPSHIYGFNNRIYGEQHQGPRVIRRYDEWAENLTWKTALHKARDRLIENANWTLGLIPIALILAAGLWTWRWQLAELRIFPAALLSLSVAHIPYWFDGMFGFHYIFESSVLWLIWLGGLLPLFARYWLAENRGRVAVWWALIILTSVTVNYALSHERRPLWSAPIRDEIAPGGTVGYSRLEHGRIAARIARGVNQRPALVLIDSDPADYHKSYVSNVPGLDSEILLAHYLPDRYPLTEIRRLFPGRKLYLYQIKADFFRPLD